MAASFTCDGCGANVASPNVVGFVIRRDYCEPCAQEAAQFLADEEAERLAVQVAFHGKREKLLQKYAKTLAKLPDIP